MVFRDLPVPADAFVMLRGQYDKPGDKVLPGVPAALPPLKLPDGAKRATRLDLAKWIVSPDNPLAARVAVNRLWQQFFGVGLVRTSSDFGSQGEPPSHPELLDWLASEYRSHWDTKKLVKLIVTSDAFRRDAAQPPAARAKDPENRLLSRGPRFRLDAEQLRDNVPGRERAVEPEDGRARGERVPAAEHLGAGRVRGQQHPLLPAGPRRGAVPAEPVRVHQADRPAPFLSNFDATNREQLCAAATAPTRPLQALQLMNDVQHVEAARALAERVLSEGGKGTAERVAFLYRTVLNRKPGRGGIEAGGDALAKQRELFASNPEGAQEGGPAGESKPRGVADDVEVARGTMVCNLVLNLDETVTRN
jgi:hypothetical protein